MINVLNKLWCIYSNEKQKGLFCEKFGFFVCLANNAFFSEINTYEKQQITITNTFLGAKNILNFLQAIKKQIHLVSHYNKHNYSKLVAKVHTVFAFFTHTHTHTHTYQAFNSLGWLQTESFIYKFVLHCN
jgi:hypothetical protein